MENQNTNQYTISQHHKKVLYTAAGCSLLAAILLVVILIGMAKNPQSQQTAQVTKTQQNVVPTPTQGNQAEQTAVTPMPINNAQDVNNALQQVNSTDPSSIGTDLNQNTSDASQFSQ